VPVPGELQLFSLHQPPGSRVAAKGTWSSVANILARASEFAAVR
jgi:hypothetical protein